jgi:hypothetical protein
MAAASSAGGSARLFQVNVARKGLEQGSGLNVSRSFAGRADLQIKSGSCLSYYSVSAACLFDVRVTFFTKYFPFVNFSKISFLESLRGGDRYFEKAMAGGRAFGLSGLIFTLTRKD